MAIELRKQCVGPECSDPRMYHSEPSPAEVYEWLIEHNGIDYEAAIRFARHTSLSDTYRPEGVVLAVHSIVNAALGVAK